MTLRFDVARAGPVSLLVFDVTGRLVRTLFRGHTAREHHRFTWDATDDEGRALPSGIYVCKLETVDGSSTRKLALVR